VTGGSGQDSRPFSFLVLAGASHLAQAQLVDDEGGEMLADHWDATAFRRRACLAAASREGLSVLLDDADVIGVILGKVRDAVEAGLVSLDALSLAP